MLFAIKSAMIGELKKPYLKCAFLRVEFCHRAVNFEKDSLRHVLSLPSVPNDLERNTEDEPLVSIEQHCKSIINAIPQKDHQLFVSRQFQISQARLCSARPRQNSRIHY